MDISGSIISIDAMGCSPAIADKIISQQANYLLTLKENNGFFYEQVRDHLDRALVGYLGDDLHTEVDFGHGRLERRTCYVSDALQWIDGTAEWKGLTHVAVVEREREGNGQISVNRSYYLCSVAGATAQQILEWSRNHWGIENNLHWVLDVAFGEDACKVTTGQGPINLATIRKLAIRIIQEDGQMKGSVKIKRKIAGWNDEYMKSILQKVVGL
ncbi:MAG: ISAs1 family transposase [Bacteroidota bacterium]